MNFALRRASGLPLAISSSFKVLLFPSIRSVSNSTLPKPPKLPEPLGLENMSSARDWIEKFRSSSIPREAVQLSFARSSGPGGQVRKSTNVCWDRMTQMERPPFAECQQSEYKVHRPLSIISCVDTLLGESTPSQVCKCNLLLPGQPVSTSD